MVDTYLVFDDLTQQHREATAEEAEVIRSYISDENTMNGLAEIYRQERNALLASTDWVVSGDRVASQGWLDYRQALRDITTHEQWPDLRPQDWPVRPE